MALGTNDLIRDNGISRGIGTSPLVSQTIQRNSIEELRSLRSAVAESQASIEGSREQHLQKAQREFNKNRQQFVDGGGGRGGDANISTPRFVLSVSPGYNAVLDDRPGAGSFFGGGNAAKYSIRGADLNGSTNYQFHTDDELQAFLKANPEIAGSTVGLSGDRLQQAGYIDNIGLRRVGLQDAESLLYGRQRQPSTVIGTPFKRGSSTNKIEQSELSKFGTPKAAEIDFGKIDRNTQAKMFDAELTRYNTIAKSLAVISNFDDFYALTPEQQIALAVSNEPTLTGKFKAFQSAAKLGLVRGK